MRITEIASNSPTELFKTYEKDIDRAFDTNKFLFRGIQSNVPLFVEDSTNKNRPSKDTKSWYMRIMENDPAWSKYPFRKNSFICTTKSFYAEQYGPVYRVIPLDANQQFAVCPDTDFWESFPKLTHYDLDVDKLQSKIAYLFGVMARKKLDFNTISETDYDMMVQEMEIADKLFRQNKGDVESYSRLPDEITKMLLSKGILKTLKYYLKPFNFDIVNQNKLPNPNSTSKEVWFSGPALFMTEKAVKKYEKFKHS